ncbi:hypothetical protein MMC16_004539 [Acarospora aff. strigata]|nr:hypothetical protein [Acarospora aff. strigata]
MSSSSRQPFVTPDDQGTIVSVVTWFLIVATTLAVIARVATKLMVARRINADDYTIFAALLFSIAQSIAVSFQRWGGLGRHMDTLTTVELTKFQKSSYAADLMFIPNLCFAKLSVLFLLRSITPVARHRNFALALGLTIAIWAVVSELVVAFRCQLPSPWNFLDNKCIDRIAFWNSFGVLNILTDLPLIILPLVIIWSINIEVRRKLVILACFAPRMSVLAAILAQLIYLNRTSTSTPDPTYTTLPLVLTTQLVQNLSVITACIVYLKPFFESLESGMIRSDDLRRRRLKILGKGSKGSGYGSAGSGGAGAGRYAAKYTAPTRLGRVVVRSKDREREREAQRREDEEDKRELELGGTGHCATVTTGAGAADRDKDRDRDRDRDRGGDGGGGGGTGLADMDWDAESQRSQSKIIRTTRSWTVDVGRSVR